MDLFDIVISGKIRKEGGGDVSVDALSVTENGTYTAEEGHAYSPVTVSVPQGVFPSGTLSITSNGTYDVGSFASADVNVSGGGGGISIDDIAMGAIDGVVSGSATAIASYAFWHCSSITEAIFPSAKYIYSSAFDGCKSLSNVSFPQLKEIGFYAFQSCGLSSLYLPSCSSIGSNAFKYCSSLKTADCPKLSYIGASAFNNCYLLSSISFPLAIGLGEHALRNCSALSSAYFPKVSTISQYALANNANLTQLRFDNLSSRISAYAFMSCSALMSIFLYYSSVVSLMGTSHFVGTPIEDSSYTGAFGSIYVPASIVSNYKASDKWNVYADRITAIPEE